MIDQSQLDTVADRIYRAGLSVPAIFFLELNKPLTGLIYTATSIAAPLAEPLLGQHRFKSLMQFFESRESVEALILLIEHKLDNRSKA